MKISLIVAMARNRVIGNENKLPWKLPADLKRFKETTRGHTVIMGRKTHESIGRPLPDRLNNIVITRDSDFSADGCTVVHSLEEALMRAEGDEVFVIGGGKIYAQALARADRLYITFLHQDFEGDSFFPEIQFLEWKEISCERGKRDEKNPYDYDFIVLERKSF